MDKLDKSQALKALEKLRPFIGNTPLFPFATNQGARVYAKLEWQQFGQSVKSRAAFSMIEKAIRDNELQGSRGILDATSGNTGIALASIGAILGIEVTLCVPENISSERKLYLESAGAILEYTSSLESTDGAQNRAKEMANLFPEKYYYTDQYSNEANWQAHYRTTALEIWEQTGRQITHFICGLGTSGTFVGTGRRLRELNPSIKLISLQPDSPMHGLEGWKHMESALVPKIYDSTLASEVRDVSTQAAYNQLKETARKFGWLVSPSSGANLAGAFMLSKELSEGDVVVTILPDDAGRYIHTIGEIFA